MTTIVYGASDDLIEVEGDLNEEFDYLSGCGYRDPYYLGFSDGTLLEIRYDQEWVIKLVEGRAIVWPVVSRELQKKATYNWNKNIPDYSDVAVLPNDVTWVVGGTDVVK